MEFLRALVAADATKLALLALILVLIVIALPRFTAAVRAWRDNSASRVVVNDRVSESVRRLIDERSQHKVNSAISPLERRVSIVEETMDEQVDRGAAQATAIARLEERQTSDRGWLEAIDKRLENGFDRVEKKIEAMGAKIK